jgi:hypothetical protein
VIEEKYSFLVKFNKMVLKNLVRYIINKYLKDYIEQLDYERLKLDLKNGKIYLIICKIFILFI